MQETVGGSAEAAPRLYTRRSSGLVREMSGTAALMGSVCIVNLPIAAVTLMLLPFAFPGASMPLSVVLLSLIARNASIELLGKRDDERWRRGWERVLAVASTLARFCGGLSWGAA